LKFKRIKEDQNQTEQADAKLAANAALNETPLEFAASTEKGQKIEDFGAYIPGARKELFQRQEKSPSSSNKRDTNLSVKDITKIAEQELPAAFWDDFANYLNERAHGDSSLADYF